MTPRSVTLQVFGTPQPKGSARGFVAMKAGQKPRAIVTSDNKRLRSWEDSIRFAAQEHAGTVFFNGAVDLSIQFYFQRPKSVSPKKRPLFTTRPDLSKLIRGAEDALNGIIWSDDAIVVGISAGKFYAVDGDPACAIITITEAWSSLPAPTVHQPDLLQEHPHV